MRRGVSDGELGGICGYAKSKYEERVEEKRRRRSQSAPKTDVRPTAYGKLHKPPRVHSPRPRPQRKRLQKQPTLVLKHQRPKNNPYDSLFTLNFEPYPYETKPSKVLGVYSTIDRVTSGAFKHGAYAFSKEGLLDGSEYLCPMGRIKMLSLPLTRTGPKAPIRERGTSNNGELIRLDIPHPENQGQSGINHDGNDQPVTQEDTSRNVFLAMRQGQDNASCIGVYSDKSLAWGACLKDKTMCASTYTLCDESRSIGTDNMPNVTARLIGSGRYTWFVEGHVVDSTT